MSFAELLIGVVDGVEGASLCFDAKISGTATWLTAGECMTDSCQPKLVPAKLGLAVIGILRYYQNTS